MEPTKKLFKVLKATVVGDLSYEEGQTYELTDEQAAAFAEGELEVVATPEAPAPEAPVEPGAGDAPAPEAPAAPAPDAPAAPAPEASATPAPGWAGGHTVGRE